MGRKLCERSRHLLHRPCGKGRRVVVATLKHRERQATLHTAQEHGRLRDADALSFHARQSDDLPRALREADRRASRTRHGLDDGVSEQAMPGSRLLPRRLVRRAGSQQDAPFSVDARECERIARACGRLQHARRCLAAEAAIEYAQDGSRLCRFERVRQARHRQRCAGEVSCVRVEQHQVAIRRAMSGERDDHHIVCARGCQSAKHRVGHFRVGCGLVDEQAASEVFNRIGEKRPQRRRVASGAAQFGDGGV